MTSLPGTDYTVARFIAWLHYDSQKNCNLAENPDWSTAAIEVAIVVLGIFIGLQVDDWNNARKDRIAETEYLNRLHSDVHTVIALQEHRLSDRREVLVEIGDAADILIGTVDQSEWEEKHCRAIAQSHIFIPLPTAVPVLNEMFASGKVSLIQDVRLRDALSRTLIQVERSTEMLARIDASVRVLTRHYPEAISETIVRAPDDPGRRHTDHAVCDLEAILASPAMMSDLADNYSRFRAYVFTGLQQTHDDFQELHRLLDEQLGISQHDS